MKGSAFMIETARSDIGDDDDQPMPGPLAGRVRMLKAAVTFMGVMLVVGTVILVIGIVWKASQLPKGSATGAGTFPALDIAVPPGASLRSLAMDGDRMAVTLDTAPNEIVIIDIGRGAEVGRIRLKPGGAAQESGAASP
jgi:hypothetical protein